MAANTSKDRVRKFGHAVVCAMILLLCILCGTFAQAQSTSPEHDVRIGVLAHRGPEKTLKAWGATAEYLQKHIPQHSFVIVPLDFDKIGPAVMAGSVDFVIANPSIYVELEALYGATRIATMQKSGLVSAGAQFGSVIISRSDRNDIRSLADIKGKSFLAVDETSLGGWQMAWYEFHQQGIDPYGDFRSLTFSGTHDSVIYAVRDGKADAGTARADTFAQLVRENKIDAGDLRILSRQNNPSYPYPVSTALYPEWPIARLRNTDDEVAQLVVIHLLEMRADTAAARDAGVVGWTTPLNYTPVHNLMRELHLGPYKDYGKITWSAVWSTYRYVILSAAIMALILSAYTIFVIILNRRMKRTQLRFERLKNQQELILNAAGDGIFGLDKEGLHTFINEAGASMLGYRREELVGKASHETWHHTSKDGKHVPGEACSIYAAYRDGIVHTDSDDIFWKKDGTSFPVEYVSTPIREHGTVTGAVVVFRDITQRQQMERAVREKSLENERAYVEIRASQEKLQSVFNKVEQAKREWELSMDRLGDMIILLDGHGNIKRCNRKFQEVTGLSYEQVVGNSWSSVVASSGFSGATLGDETSGQVKEIHHPATNTWYRLDTYVYAEEKLKISGRIITLHDYTEVKLASDVLAVTNAELEKNRSGLQDALDQLSYLLDQVIQKQDLSVRFDNPNVMTCHEVMKCGKTNCVCYTKSSVRCWQVAGTYCGGKAQGAFVEKFGRCSECPVYREATADPIYTIGENFNNMMHILEVQHKDLEKAYIELKTAQSTILQQEKMASVGQLAAGVAHEINNPVGFIMSNLGSLKKYADKLAEFLRIQDAAVAHLPAEEATAMVRQRKALKVDFIIEDIDSLIKESLDGAERVKRIVQDLKGFSRVDEVAEKLADINAGIESTINIVWNELKYKAVVKKDFGEIPQIVCNPGQLNQVFMNLLVNAAHAIEKQGEIGIRTWTENNSILVSISDTGCGIPPEKVARIFEPFFTTKPVGKGTGLGLSIAYDIIKKHNGSIEVESVVGKGTTFTIRIPLVVSQKA